MISAAGARARARRLALTPAVAVGGVLAGALALRVWAFGGVVSAHLGDDARYVAVAQNLANGHLPDGPSEWFGTRVVFLWPVAGLFRLLGANDLTAVVWPLALSLVAVLAAYLLGRDLATHRVGLVAAGLVAAAPIETMMASRLRPDAAMPGLVALAVWAALRAGRAPAGAGRWAAASGLLLGAAWSVRESAVVMAPVLVAAGWRAGRRAVLPGLAGAAAVPAIACAVFAALGASPLAPVTAAAGTAAGRDPLDAWSWDGSYLARLGEQALDPGALGFLLLPAVAAAGLALVLRRDRRAVLPAAWLGWAALYLEVGTLANLSKPIRFLTLCAVPAALLVALAADARLGAVAVASVAAVAVVALAPMPARAHRADDVLLVSRVADRLRGLPPGPVATESYTWWAKLTAYTARARLPVPQVEDPEFLDAAARRQRRRLEPLPEPGAAAGGYVIVGPVHPSSGWPSNWGAYRRRLRAVVPWSRLVPVARVGAAVVYRWPIRSGGVDRPDR